MYRKIQQQNKKPDSINDCCPQDPTHQKAIRTISDSVKIMNIRVKNISFRFNKLLPIIEIVVIE